MDQTRERFIPPAERGMMLIEIMVVVAIIGLVMSAVGVFAFEAYRRAQRKVAQSDIHDLKVAVRHWAINHSGETCPNTLQELYTLKYIVRAPRDPWGREFLYACPSQTSGEDDDIVSKGPDGQPGTDDDIKEEDAKAP